MTRTKVVGIRLSEEEAGSFEKRAQELGICVAELMRQATRGAAGMPSTVTTVMSPRESPRFNGWPEDASRVFGDAFWEDFRRRSDEAGKVFEQKKAAKEAAKAEAIAKKKKPQPLNKKGSKS